MLIWRMDTITIILVIALLVVGGIAVFALSRGRALRAAADQTNGEIVRMASSLTPPVPTPVNSKLLELIRQEEKNASESEKGHFPQYRAQDLIRLIGI